MRAGLFQHVPQGRLGLLPVLFAADVLVALGIAERELHAVVVQADRFEHEPHQVERGTEFLLDLLRRAEEMGIVLREAADAEHAVEFARLLVAINGAELGQPHRQVAVAPRLGLVDLDVVRAVHRLEQIPLLRVLPAPEDLDFFCRVGGGLIAVEIGPHHTGRGDEFLLFAGVERSAVRRRIQKSTSWPASCPKMGVNCASR